MLNKRVLSMILSVVITIYLIIVTSLAHLVVVEAIEHHCTQDICSICIYIDSILTNLEQRSSHVINIYCIMIMGLYVLKSKIITLLNLRHETLVTRKICIIS